MKKQTIFFSARVNEVLSKLCFLFILFFLCFTFASAQDLQSDSADTTANRAQTSTPLVYIDCDACDYNYIRQEITFVNYVRDPNQADVHVFITVESTGSGGRQYDLSFIGRRNYSSIEYEFTHKVDRNATSDERRESLNEVLELGLTPYVIKTSDVSLFSLQYDGSEEGESVDREVEDPWNYWVFEIYAGSLQLNLESNQREFDSRWGFYADRVTEDWKIRVRPYFNYEFVEIDQNGSDESVTSRRHRHGINSYAIKSLDDHWSAGVFSNYITRNDRNLQHRFRLTPGIEYNIFPYQIATRKAITFTYTLGYAYADYYEETIFQKQNEHLLNQELTASVHFEQPWGEIEGGLEGSHYFHDLAHRRAEVFANVSVRLTEGLSLSVYGQFEKIQDQLSLPRGDTSLEDVLLQQRELATDFSFYGSISLSYTFGSDFANVVNTRF